MFITGQRIQAVSQSGQPLQRKRLFCFGRSSGKDARLAVLCAACPWNVKTCFLSRDLLSPRVCFS